MGHVLLFLAQEWAFLAQFGMNNPHKVPNNWERQKLPNLLKFA